MLLLGALGRFLASSWALFKCPWDPLGLILVPRDLPSLHLRGSGDVPGWIFEGFLDFLLMLLWMWSLRICIHLRCSFTPSGAAVCARHIRRLPKGEPSVPNDPLSSCQVLFAPTFKLQNTSSKLWAQESFLKCLPPILCSFPLDPHGPPHFVRNLLLRLQNAIF